MTAVFHPWWFAVGALAFAVAVLLTRPLASPAARLGVRCLVLAAVVTPQPLWAPGDGSYVLPAVLLLASGHFGFAWMNGLMPVLAVAGILFTLGGYLSRLRRDERSARAHRFVQRWVLLGVVLPFLALILVSPWLAIFLFGGALAFWSGFSLCCLLGGVGLDRRTAIRNGAASGSAWFQRASAGLLGLMLALALLGLRVLA